MKNRSTPRPRGLLAAGAAALLLMALAAGGGAQDESTDDEVLAQVQPLALESLLLDGDSAGDHLVAVGTRGHVLLSDDAGETWRQATRVPTRVTLTAVFLHDESTGWAVGHNAVILRTRDGGETWEEVYSAPEEQLPLLDVWFRDADEGVAIGAYGYFLETTDGGDSWSQITLEVTGNDVAEDIFAYDEGGDFHLNHLSRAASGDLYIAAEAGTIYHSGDDGLSWEELPSPYEGSYFGALPLAGESLLVFGLRGHLFRSDDGGQTWEELDSGTESMLTDGVVLADGTVVLVGLAGTVLTSADGGRTFRLHAQPDRQGYSSILAAEGSIVLFGEFGVTKLGTDQLQAG